MNARAISLEAIERVLLRGDISQEARTALEEALVSDVMEEETMRQVPMEAYEELERVVGAEVQSLLLGTPVSAGEVTEPPEITFGDDGNEPDLSEVKGVMDVFSGPSRWDVDPADVNHDAMRLMSTDLIFFPERKNDY